MKKIALICALIMVCCANCATQQMLVKETQNADGSVTKTYAPEGVYSSDSRKGALMLTGTAVGVAIGNNNGSRLVGGVLGFAAGVLLGALEDTRDRVQAQNDFYDQAWAETHGRASSPHDEAYYQELENLRAQEYANWESNERERGANDARRDYYGR